jgi:hypothetical protein
LRKKYQCCYAS